MIVKKDLNQVKEIKPPVTEVGFIGWLKANLFNTPFNSILTILVLACCFKIIPLFVSWAFIDSVWCGPPSLCHEADGAC
ncbi:MAG: hypothetical protein U9P10_08275 [Thermodesulfobacteriota bacterium]|nr:hypothetical protein [Thermodesulfobacteriota bacterium]